MMGFPCGKCQESGGKGLRPHLPPTTFASEVLRPTVGIILYAAAVGLGWFVHPVLAVGIFIFVVGYYAWTSQGIHVGS